MGGEPATFVEFAKSAYTSRPYATYCGGSKWTITLPLLDFGAVLYKSIL